jgi:hypothetical protein
MHLKVQHVCTILPGSLHWRGQLLFPTTSCATLSVLILILTWRISSWHSSFRASPYLARSLLAIASRTLIPSTICAWKSILYSHVQYFINVHACKIISVGCLIVLFSKHTLFLAFLVAQQIGASPNACNAPHTSSRVACEKKDVGWSHYLCRTDMQDC